MNTQAPLLLNPVLSESFDITTPTDPGYLRGLASEEKAYKASLCMARLGKKIKSLKTPPIVSVFWTK